MFIARQPIFNKILNVFGYELLFRMDSKATVFGGTSSEKATATVMVGLFEEGIERIVEDKYAFVNFDEAFIHSDSLEMIPPNQLVVEMLEDIKVDEKLVKRLTDLKAKGYKIALDDFMEDYEEYPLVPIAHIIKFDLLETPLETIEEEVKKAIIDNKVILAEKVETKEMFNQAKEMGFHLFQGYFFSKPSIISETNSKMSSTNQYTKILLELKKEEPSYDVLVAIIEKDVDLAYRFLKVMSHRSDKNVIESIRIGLTYMGLNEIERWISILMLQDMGSNKPKELITMSLVRTKFAEKIAKHGENRGIQYAASMMGLLSTIDGMLDKTMKEALEGMSLDRSIKEALIEKKGKLYPIYQLLLAYEKGDWGEVVAITQDRKIDPEVLGKDYLESVKWANEVSDLMA